MTHRWTERRARFRALMSGDTCIVPASVFDPISARIAADLGFKAGMLGGSVASLAILGAPDNMTITLSEFAGLVLRISRASDMPLMVDADHGYGGALNVMRTVEELEFAGVAGLSIEDTLLPEPFGVGPPRMISREEGAGKMYAAVAARRDPSLVIAGRTSALAIAGLDETLQRVAAYTAAGVDAIFLIGAKSAAEIEAVRGVTRLPLILGAAPPSLPAAAELAKLGVRLCLQGHQSFPAAVQAIYATLKALREGADPKSLPGIANADLMNRVTRADQYAGYTRDFLGGKK
jgi:oxaloacetate decarboxylase